MKIIRTTQPISYTAQNREAMARFSVRAMWAMFGDGDSVTTDTAGSESRLKYARDILAYSRVGCAFDANQVFGGAGGPTVISSTPQGFYSPSNKIVSTVINQSYSFSIFLDAYHAQGSTGNPFQIFGSQGGGGYLLTLNSRLIVGSPNYVRLTVTALNSYNETSCTYDVPVSFSGLITFTLEDNTTWKLYANGAETTPTASQTSGSYSVGTEPWYSPMGGSFGQYTYASLPRTNLVLFHDRTLSAPAAMELSRNVWQLFEPERRTVFLPPAVTSTTKRFHRTPIVRTTQPQGYTPIDIDGSLTNRMTHAVLISARADMITGPMMYDSTNNGVVSGLTVTEHGPCYKSIGGSTNGIRVPGPTSGFSSKEVSIVAVIRFSSGATYRAVAGNMHNYGGYGSQLYIDDTNRLMLEVTDGPYGTLYSAVSVDPIPLGELCVVGASLVSGTVNRWLMSINGKSVAFTGGASSPTTLSETHSFFTIGCRPNGGSAIATGDEIYGAFAWNQAKSQEELNEISENPWQLYKPEARMIFINTGITSFRRPSRVVFI